MERSPALRTITNNLGTIHQLEPGDPTDGVTGLLHGRAPLSVDTETTGLDVYREGFAVRLVQLGSATEAYVWEPSHFPELTARVTTTRPVFYWNASFDLLAIEHALGVPLAEMAPNVADAQILAKLLDPREKAKGGVGFGLKEQSAHVLGLDVADARKVVQEHARREYKLGKDECWAKLPAADPVYVEYAGQDVLLTSRIGEVLAERIRAAGLGWLAEFEHRLAYDLLHLTRRGTALDVPWVRHHMEAYAAEHAEHEAAIAGMGVKPTATGNYATAKRGLLDRFGELGVAFSEVSPKTGEPKLDDAVMKAIAAKDDEAATLAGHVLASKRAKHFGEGYLQGFLDVVGTDGRIHPTVNPLAAATGRMSISRPALQQMPSKESALRGCLIADPGHVFVGADYSSVEVRITAAVSGDPALKAEIDAGRDPLATMAAAVFGDEFTKEQRGQAKSGFYGRVYGGGARTLAKQMGVEEELVQRVIGQMDRMFPGVRQTSHRLAEAVDASGGRFLSSTGRLLVTDRGYTAMNYSVQSPARDIFAEAVVKLFDSGLGDALRLVVHDEMILSVPEHDAEEAARTLETCMRTEFRGVPIDADAEIKGRRWAK